MSNINICSSNIIHRDILFTCLTQFFFVYIIYMIFYSFLTKKYVIGICSNICLHNFTYIQKNKTKNKKMDMVAKPF